MIMKICWFCIPAYGHTNPTLELVKKLTSLGHEVYYFSFEKFREKIEAAGGNFIGCDSYEPEMSPGSDKDNITNDLAASTELLVSATLALDEMSMKKISEIKPDLIVSDSVAYWGKLAAVKCGIPYVSSTTTFAFNRYSAKYMKQGFSEMVNMFMSMPKINKQIKRLQDNGYPVKSIIDIVQNDNDTNTIVYTSDYFQPCAETFSDKYCFIGPSIRPAGETFEKSDKKTVFISMGTVIKNENFFNECIDAFSGTDYRVIISLGNNNKLSRDSLPDNIKVYDFVDQMAVLAASDMFITHCGMNSVSEALYFGVPLILCPQTAEQSSVAKRVEELGAGILLKAADKKSITEAVGKISGDTCYKKSADKISESFKKSGGAEKAARFLESIAGK